MIFVFVALGVGAIILAILVGFALKNGGRARLVKETPLAQTGRLVPGPAKLAGRSVALGGELDAPLSGRPCVYYSFRVQERRSHATPHGGGGHWKTVIDDRQTASCGLDDGTGIAAVSLGEAEFVLASTQKASSGFWTGASPELERMLNERYQRSAQGLIFNKSMRYAESRIEVGQQLVVVGMASPTPGGHWMIGREGGPLIVSDLGDEGLVSHYRRFRNLLWFLAVLVIVLTAIAGAIAWGAV